MLTLETRVKNLETLVNALSKKIDSIKYYQDADTQGVRQGVANITPYTDTKTAYISDTEAVFNNVPDGNMSVYIKDENGSYPDYSVERTIDTVTVSFAPLEYITTITISIQ